MYPAAINRLYYSMFYSLNALALNEGFKTGKHAQLIGWFNKHWIKEGKIDVKYSKIISNAFDKRMLGDYADIPEFSEEEVLQISEEAEDFIGMIEIKLKDII